MNRSAPTDGYDFGAKRQYRRDVWATFSRFAARQPRLATALLMPSAEGDEVEVALRNNFREDRLHLADQNAAIAAHLKRRYRRSTCHGVSVSRAAERLAKRGVRLDVANLDLCGHIDVGSPTANEIRAFITTGVMADRSLLAITTLRGRERRLDWLKRSADVISDVYKQREVPINGHVSHEGDAARITELVCLLREPVQRSVGITRYLPKLLRHGTYRSNHQTLLWAVFVLFAIIIDDSGRRLATSYTGST